MVHRNFERTEEMVLNLLDMDDKLDSLEDMLDADRNDLMGPASNLLPVHYQINQLEAFRNQTMHHAKKASAASRAKLAQRFERLNVLCEAFDEYIAALAKNILPIIRSGHPEVIVKLIKIAEKEGREDEKAGVDSSHLAMC
jgi:exocyst complex component 3